jgi:hypothetical protein
MTGKIMDHVVGPPAITGSTTINHAARVAMGLNCSEYVMMNYTFYCAKNGKNLDAAETYQKTGFIEQEALQIMRGLVQKGFVLMSENPIPQITTKWESAFTNIEDEFENSFWKKDGKVVWLGSSRKMSLGFYVKARKRYSKEVLIQSRDEYLEYLEWCKKDNFNRAIMGCEKFLNEKNEYYLVDWKTMSKQLEEKLKPLQKEQKPVEPLTKEARKKLYNE